MGIPIQTISKMRARLREAGRLSVASRNVVEEMQVFEKQVGGVTSDTFQKPLTPSPPVKDEIMNSFQDNSLMEDHEDTCLVNDATSVSSPVDADFFEQCQMEGPSCQQENRLETEEGIPSEDANYCLLCLQKMKKDQTPVLTNDIVDANFNAMFILQKMLDIPKARLGEYLETVGAPPGEWIVFCRKCLKLVDEAVSIQKEISDLEEKLRRCQTGMFQKILTSRGEVEQLKGGRRGRKTGMKKKAPSIKSDIVEVLADIQRFIKSRESRENDNEASPVESFGIDTEPSPPDTPGAMSDSEATDVKFDPKPASVNDGVGSMKALNAKGYTCSSCPTLEVMNLGTLINHGLFHFRRPLKCYQCGLHFSSSSELKENPFAKIPGSTHICSGETLVQTIFNPSNIWKCSFCPERFSFDVDRDSHEIIQHSLSLSNIDLHHKCISCSKQFRNLAERLLHRVLEHPEVASLSCLFCDQTFSSQIFDGTQIPDISKINDHIRKEHTTFPSKRLPDECHFCGACFWTTTNLQLHMAQAHNLNKTLSYSCSICHCRRSSRPNLADHMIRIHMLDDSSRIFCETLSCQLCGYKTTKEVMLFEHKLTKHGVEPEDGRHIYICRKEGCGFRTLMDQSFTKHLMKEHEEVKKYICRFCGKQFHKPNHRGLHEQIHLNKELRPYQCEMCGKSYAVKTYLFVHKRTAHKNRPDIRSAPRRRLPHRVVGTACVRIEGGGVNQSGAPLE